MSRAIDELIVFRVMGWVRWGGPSGHKCHGLPNEGGHRDIPEYSTDPAAAMEVVERCCLSILNAKPLWVVGTRTHETDGRIVVELAQADSFCMAVCLAALRAVGVPEAEIEKARSL